MTMKIGLSAYRSVRCTVYHIGVKVLAVVRVTKPLAALCCAALILGLTCLRADAQTAEWTWMGGSNTPPCQGLACGAPGVYGTLGAPAAGNVPGGRFGASSWTDTNGNFWLFGGSGYDASGAFGHLNDLWEFNVSTRQWAWMGGSSTIPGIGGGQPGVYGTLGTPAAGNAPGGRSSATGWTDMHGNFWLFGGDGYDSTGTLGSLNDLWEFNVSTGEWAWMSGSNKVPGTVGLPGVYGTLGVPAAGNSPGSRTSASSWTDGTGNLWIFGGLGLDSNGIGGSLNELWEFNVSTREWAWMGGSSTIPYIEGGQPGVYGTLGTPAPGNIPGGRDAAVSWTDNSGNLWLFGGYGFDSADNLNDLNDLWMFSPSTNEWAWMGGVSRVPGGCGTPDGVCGMPGVYGTLGTPAAGNSPGSRGAVVSWTDKSGHFWLLGGVGWDSTDNLGWLNDLWEFNPATRQWAWMSGSNTLVLESGNVYSISGVYGALGVPAAANVPGGRRWPNGWVDGNGYLWLFGGDGFDATGKEGSLNDLWEYQPGTPPPPAATPTFSVPPGTYASPQTVTISDATSGAAIYYTTNGTAPTASSTLYTGPITVSVSETIEAVAIASSYSISTVATAAYTINISTPSPAATPTFSVPPGVYTSPQNVAISDTTPGATIYYTTNGTSPTTSSTQYTVPITVSSTETIEAIAVASGYANSAVATTTYTFGSASPVTILANFNGTNGASPWSMSLVQGTDGSLYGTTAYGGANNDGTVFKVTTAGAITTLYSFCPQTGCADGKYPFGGLVLANDGNFYGTTTYGGADNLGTVFKITPAGTLTTLHSFTGTEGADPSARLLQAADGNLYGVTTFGGAGNVSNCPGTANNPSGCGTVFKVTLQGTLSALYSFCTLADCPDGDGPDAGLIQGTDGNLYGTTLFNGGHAGGTVFKITPNGTLTTLYSFCSQSSCGDGGGPYSPLIQATNGNFYGTTALGGQNYNVTPCDQGGGGGYGTVFELTAGGVFTPLHAFNNTDGSVPDAGLVQGTDGNFYGTTACGGANGAGTIFVITPAGTLDSLYSYLGSPAVGAGADGGLVQATNGIFYGTTPVGGTNNKGTVYSLNMGLGPFVETLPTSGAAGTSVMILGTNLTGTTGVAFNGAAATFTVVSSNEAQATVPAAATAGPVQVATPAGMLNSNLPFQVTPGTQQPTATPTFSVPSGAYNTPQTVTISDATPGAAIYYTTNGSTPTLSSPLYTGPIAVDSTETLEAFATAIGFSASAVHSATYTIPVQPVANIASSTLTFAGLLVNSTSAAQAVTLSNAGSMALTINSITASTNFAQTNNCGGSLAANASCTINVTFKPTAAGSLTGTLTVTDNSNNAAGSTQTVSLSGTGQDFSFSTATNSPTSATVTPGSPASYILSLGSLGGMVGTVSFTCTGAPSEATCTVSPNPASPGASVTVNVTTTAPSRLAPHVSPPPLRPPRPQPLLGLAILLICMVGALSFQRSRGGSMRRLPLVAGCLLLLVLAACGGGGGGGGTTPSNPGTPAGTYTLMVTGTAGAGSSAVSHSVSLTIIVS
ncbi:MAG TPA: choice-of-anchor tandem repeat GloVer-containing protein [Terriglobia bacterium]|nr:choice-of-anchor tandem repeat GloVer-containing protein [Terriglobia bacterium]